MKYEFYESYHDKLPAQTNAKLWCGPYTDCDTGRIPELFNTTPVISSQCKSLSGKMHQEGS